MPPKDSDRHDFGDLASVESWLVSAGRNRRPGSPLNVPPWPASNFVLGEQRAYSRDDGTPGWEALEEIVGGLEGGLAVAFASGMAGIAAIFDQLSTGSVVVLPDDCYQGVAGLANAGQSRGRWTVHRVAVADTARWIQMCREADLIWLESPSNPLLTVADLDTICAAPRKRGGTLRLTWRRRNRPRREPANCPAAGARTCGCNTRYPRNVSRGTRGTDAGSANGSFAA